MGRFATHCHSSAFGLTFISLIYLIGSFCQQNTFIHLVWIQVIGSKPRVEYRHRSNQVVLNVIILSLGKRLFSSEFTFCSQLVFKRSNFSIELNHKEFMHQVGSKHHHVPALDYSTELLSNGIIYSSTQANRDILSNGFNLSIGKLEVDWVSSRIDRPTNSLHLFGFGIPFLSSSKLIECIYDYLQILDNFISRLLRSRVSYSTKSLSNL